MSDFLRTPTLSKFEKELIDVDSQLRSQVKNVAAICAALKKRLSKYLNLLLLKYGLNPLPKEANHLKQI